MTALPTIAVILPCPADGGGLDRTLFSLAAQDGPFQLRCHTVQAASKAAPDIAQQLGWWRQRTRGSRPPAGLRPLEISHQTAAADSLAGRLAQGMEACSGADLCGWMMPGDTLQPAALQTIAEAVRQFPPEELSWLNGSAAAPLPAPVMQAGLCDGTHWEALPAAGTFFRPWLWQKAALDPALQDPDPGTAAWALWRQFSRHAGLTQLPQQPQPQADPAALLPDAAALEAQLPLAARRAALERLAEDRPALTWRSLSRCSRQDSLVIREETARAALSRQCSRVLGLAPEEPPAEEEPGREAARAPRAEGPQPPEALIRFQGNILSYDSGWQYPAITEQHAFRQLSRQGAVPEGVTYLAYPWATLIDKLHRKTADLQQQLAHFRAFCARVPKDTVKVTVCQHIKMKEELELFRMAGVSDIFWSHTTHADSAANRRGGLKLHPFPLFPVQAAGPDTALGTGARERPHLFSFIGARANQHYLTGSRNWILDLLRDDPRGQITGRDGWHYNKVVYNHQIHAAGRHQDRAQAFVDGNASEEFRASLRASVFSLCPSGTGPNSIRLWESIGLGAVPVILADSWAPPGSPALWQAGAVFCKENPEAIRALPERLAALAADQHALERLRHGSRQLWALYGPDSFIYDLQKFMLEAADGLDRPAPRPALLDGLAAELAPGTPPEQAGTQAESLTEPPPPGQAGAAALYLGSLAGRLLLEGEAALEAHCGDPRARAAEAQARAALAPDHPLAAQLDQALALLCRRSGRDPADLTAATPPAAGPAAHPASPAPVRRGPLRVCLPGKHSNRTPLAYAPFRKLAGAASPWWIHCRTPTSC